MNEKTNTANETQYSRLGIWHQAIRVNWYCCEDGFIVQRHSKTGYVTGQLTDRNGFGKPHIAKVFPTAQNAANAGIANARHFTILHNVKGRHNKK